MNRLNWLIISGIIYFICLQTEIGVFIFLPIELLTTFLHEFCHAITCIISKGSVESLQINLDCSGLTNTIEGNQEFMFFSGYIGSCIISNILMWCSLSNYNTRVISIIISFCALFTAFYWYDNDISSSILICISIGFLLLSLLKIQSFILQFISIACLIDIINDFNVGPMSDLEEFHNLVGIFSVNVWMYIWLGVVLLITLFNIKLILKHF